MSRRLAQLFTIYHDLRDRYGANDPFALELAAEIRSRQMAMPAMGPHDRRQAGARGGVLDRHGYSSTVRTTGRSQPVLKT